VRIYERLHVHIYERLHLYCVSHQKSLKCFPKPNTRTTEIKGYML
jgi:hypothetical protein